MEFTILYSFHCVECGAWRGEQRVDERGYGQGSSAPFGFDCGCRDVMQVDGGVLLVLEEDIVVKAEESRL